MAHVSVNLQQQKSCIFYIVTFLIAVQPWSMTARSGINSLMASAASMKSPGEMYPKSLSILIGDNANITCRLAKPNSSEIWFLEEKSRHAIRQPSDQIKVIDPYTAVLVIRGAVEQNSRYQCKVGDYAIGETELFAGTPPLNITDFSCISHDFEYMECSFTRPKNTVLTRFDLEYKFPNDNFSYKCYCQDANNDQLKCNVSEYMPIRKEYLFTLKGKNDVGENEQHFLVNNHKIVIPPPVDVIKQNITNDRLILSLERLKTSYYKGLDYDIQIKDNNINWKHLQRGHLQCQNGKCNITISNLYAFWLYWVKVRVKSSHIDDDRFWSKETIVSFRTKPERPKRAPDTPVGSFYIDSTETQLRLYWEQMPEYEHNGPAFQYVINEINEHGDVLQSIKTNESSITLAWKNESMLMFLIKCENEIGDSIDGNIIRVYRSGSRHYELNENNIAKVYHNNSYTLSWSPPENIEELINYTVFWCLPKIEVPNQCKGPISYKYLNKTETSFTTEPKDRSLNLAISANYLHYNKGMQWARCSGDVSSELMKMELEVSALNESSILVKWSPGSVCASILKGYNLTYCQASNNDKCTTREKTIVILKEKYEYRNHTISRLPPYTNICLYMFMYSSSKHGRNSDWYCIRTKASAPSPPKNLQYVRSTVTSKSAEIQWSPPDIINGILSHYSIYWRKYFEKTFEKNTVSVNQTSYNLTGLSSYSNYEVYVTAHTIEESVPSQRINFTTLIGIPSGPRNLKLYENDTVIYWDQPDLPSGRHLFYVVALVRREEKSNAVYERVSIVKGRSCRFQQPDCINTNKTYALQVRAVNVGEKDEVDQEIIAINKEKILEGALIDSHFCKPYENELEDPMEINTKTIFQNDIEKFYFASQWIVAPPIYSCPPSSNAFIYVVALIIVIAFAAYLCCWLRSKYNKMKNIKVILPEGLVDQVSSYKKNTLSTGSESSNKKEFHSDISRSNDCLVFYGHKENHNLITDLHTSPSNALSSFSSNNSSKAHNNEGVNDEHPSLETTNEEFSSNSSSTSNSNLAHNENHQINILHSIDSNNILPASECEKEVNNCDENTNEFSTTPSGYVTHNSHLIASILTASERSAPSTPKFTTTLTAMTTDGYIQPSAAKQLFPSSFSHNQQPQTIPQDGYTCIDALNKLTTSDDLRFINSPPSNTTTTVNTSLNEISTKTTNVPSNIDELLHTSPVIQNLNESLIAECNKNAIQQSGTTISMTNTSHQPNASNKTIYGYVTQQQLASFGTKVALGKELNT